MMSLAPFACRLANRCILRVRGTDAHEFLQGVFTNDLRELHPAGSIYGCFLYFTGRVLCDAHLYQCKQIHNGQASILIDVHESCTAELFDHLTEMRMRKKVTIENLNRELVVLAMLGKTPSTPPTGVDMTCSSDLGSGMDAQANSPTLSASETLGERHAQYFADPRNDALFSRWSPLSSEPRLESQDAAAASMTVPRTSSPSPDAVSIATPPKWFLRRCVMPATWAPPLSSADPYTSLLYSRGIGEGPDVFKNNKSLPFEGNLDFLKGVSFHKGCYLGQELTHRTHVMLVTRKRTVPLRFGHPRVNPAIAAAAAATSDDAIPTTRPVQVGESLFSAAKEKIGEVTGVCGDVGVGLLRLRYVDKATKTVPSLQLKDGTSVQTQLPDWWPSKEVKKLLKNNT
ncbi:hypothetical protein JKF63_05657 [Porcisia hertigi]|uniref:CAF17 C-terminal domain-containing protein n=1 Tax=Porcisia hertigi TaxID=2761500 RepID=A0A836HPJ0_9TRYP|nr:hypothetical protein JKF63_05657 [Porcisia hertigi]